MYIRITIEAEFGIVVSYQPEVEMTSETSEFGGSHVVQVSSLVFTGNFSDLDSSLNISMYISITIEAVVNFTHVSVSA
jgi:hypothetical protein